MGDNQHIRVEPNSIPSLDFQMVVGVLCSNIMFFKYPLCKHLFFFFFFLIRVSLVQFFKIL